jgi:hypothetical protein
MARDADAGGHDSGMLHPDHGTVHVWDFTDDLAYMPTHLELCLGKGCVGAILTRLDDNVSLVTFDKTEDFQLHYAGLMAESEAWSWA